MRWIAIHFLNWIWETHKKLSRLALKRGLLVVSCVLMCADGRATVRAYYGFNDATLTADSSGNGYTLVPVGGGATCLTITPLPLEGAGSATTFSDGSSFSVPVAVFNAAMEDDGCLRFRYFMRATDADDNIILDAEGAGGGRFYIYQWSPKCLRFSVPTSAGATTFDVDNIWKLQRWHSVKLAWTANRYDVYLEDGSASTLVGTKDLGAATPHFDQPGGFAIGYIPGTATYAFAGVIDSVSFYDDSTDAEFVAPKAYYDIINWGPSTCKEDTCTPNGAWRYYSFEFWEQLGKVHHYTGATTVGTGLTPLTDGVNGEYLVDTLANAQTRLAANFPAPLPSGVVFHFTPDLISAYYDLTMTAYTTQLDDIINSVNAYSPLINQFVIFGPPVSGIAVHQPSQYVNAAKTVVADNQALGVKVHCIDASTLTDSGCDTLHWDAAASKDVGEFIAGALDDELYPSATPTNTPVSTATPSATETASPSATETDTPTATPTITQTDTPTPTITQTATPTPTYTATPTATPTSTPTATPTHTPNPYMYMYKRVPLNMYRRME